MFNLHLLVMIIDHTGYLLKESHILQTSKNGAVNAIHKFFLHNQNARELLLIDVKE